MDSEKQSEILFKSLKFNTNTFFSLLFRISKRIHLNKVTITENSMNISHPSKKRSQTSKFNLDFYTIPSYLLSTQF